jgi:hypothetical protein
MSLTRADGSVAPVAGQPAIVWFRTREETPEGYRERVRALQEAEGERAASGARITGIRSCTRIAVFESVIITV